MGVRGSHLDGWRFIHNPISYFFLVFFQQFLDCGFVGGDNSGVGINERSNIISHGVKFSLKIIDKLLNLSWLIFGPFIREPVNLGLLYLLIDVEFKTCVITGIFEFDSVAVEKIIPEIVFEGMFFEGLTFLFHLNKNKTTSGFSMAQIKQILALSLSLSESSSFKLA